MKIRDVIRLRKVDGWYQVHMRGNHRQFKHPAKRGLVTVAEHSGDELAIGTLSNIRRQAGLKRWNI